MNKGRLEAFTDGVIAIIITIMVLEMKVPHATSLAEMQASLPVLLAYVLSYINVGIFWSNHHHLLNTSERINGRVLWANLFLLFWLSLLPYVIGWIGEAGVSSLPTAAYGLVLTMAAIGWGQLQRALIACNGRGSKLATAIGGDLKGKTSLAVYVIAIPIAFVNPWFAIALYAANALVWLVPDRRIEFVLKP